MIEYNKLEPRYYFSEDLFEDFVSEYEGLKSKDYIEIRQENISHLKERLGRFLNSVTSKEVEVTAFREETEEEAREFFGNNFVKEFEEIRRRCEEEKVALAIHGTTPEIIGDILKDGLRYDSPQILSTSIIKQTADQQPEYDKYSELLNWPHRGHKGLVLLGIPLECMGIIYENGEGAQPLWMETSDGKYTINPEFIIGHINVDKKRIIYNPQYKREHNYEGLIYDTDVTIKYSETEEINDEKSETQTIKEKEEEEEEYLKMLNDFDFTDTSGIICKLRDRIRDGLTPSGYDAFILKLQEKKEILEKLEPLLKEEKKSDNTKQNSIRKGPIQVYDERGNIIIQDYINPELMKRKIVLPNGNQINAGQYIQEFVVPHIPESGNFKLKNGNEISARQYIEEFIMFELEKYNGDLDAMMQDTLAGTDVPPERDGWIQPTHGQEMGISEEQTETLSSNPRVSLEHLKKVIATKRDRKRVGFSEVKESQDEIALRQERGKLVSLSMREQLDEDGKRRLEKINSMLGIQRPQRSTDKGQKNGQYTGQGR